MYKIISLMMILCCSLTSCCAMTRQRTGCVTITAKQGGAQVFIDGDSWGITPLQVDLEKNRDHSILVTKSGYQNQEIVLKSRHTWNSARNLVFPFAGAAVGTGVGLACYGTGGWMFPLFLAGTVVGVVAGLGLGAIGAATDCYLRSDCDLDKRGVYFNLAPAIANGL